MKIATNTQPQSSSTILVRSCIAAVSVLLACLLQWIPTVGKQDFFNEWLRDRFTELHAGDQPDPRILVVDIDETSLSELGPWPWPRSRIAALLESLLDTYKARAVAMDMVFPEPGDADGDKRLSVLSQFAPLVLAQAFDYNREGVSIRVGNIAGGISEGNGASGIPATGFIANHAGLSQAAAVGNIGFIPDPDGTLRRLPIVTRFEGRRYDTLALALLERANLKIVARPAKDTGALVRVPLNRKWEAYTVAKAADVINGRIPPNVIDGRLVIVGSSALGLSDRVTTPLLASTPGMLVHAAMLSSLLDQQEGKVPAHWPGRWIALAFGATIAGLVVYLFPRFSAVTSVTLLALTSLGWLAIAYWTAPHDPGFSTTSPLVSNLFLLAVAVPFDWQISQRRSRRLLGTLRQYVAREVVDELLRRNLEDPLAPRQLHVTTLIADMEGYTTHVESLPIEEAASVTRDFLDCLTRPVLEKHGTLDKYTGDGLVAFWGAPLPNDEHADLALEAALQIVEEVRKFNAIRAKTGKPPARVRIGIESGPAMAGDFGTAFRSIYTAVGDSVNVASRLEDAARNFPHDIIVGPGTVNHAKRHRVIALGETVLRGKERATELFTVEAIG